MKILIYILLSPEFRIFFPQLTGVLTLAFFIHNCVITLLKNNRNQEKNVSDYKRKYVYMQNEVLTS